MRLVFWPLSLLLILAVSCGEANPQATLIIKDGTNSVNIEMVSQAAQPLLKRDVSIAIYVVSDGCEAEFEQNLSEDNLIHSGQLQTNTIAIFFPVPKNRACTFIRVDSGLEGKFADFNKNILSQGLVPYLADRTPRIDATLFGAAKSYSDSEALARILGSIDQFLWVIEIKPQVVGTNHFVYDYHNILDRASVTNAVQPILDRGINVDIFISDDNSLSLTPMRDYLGLNSDDRFKSIIVINIFTNTYQWIGIQSFDLSRTFNNSAAAILQAGMKQIESGEMTYTKLVVDALNAFNLSISQSR